MKLDCVSCYFGSYFQYNISGLTCSMVKGCWSLLCTLQWNPRGKSTPVRNCPTFKTFIYLFLNHFPSHCHVNKPLSKGCISVKPVLNWANVSSPNTLWRTMICFLIELLDHQTWFRQFDKLYFILNWLVMRCKLQPELVADAEQTAWSKMEAKLKSSQYTLIIPHRVIQLTTISFWVPETRLCLLQVNK